MQQSADQGAAEEVDTPAVLLTEGWHTSQGVHELMRADPLRFLVELGDQRTDFEVFKPVLESFQFLGDDALDIWDLPLASLQRFVHNSLQVVKVKEGDPVDLGDGRVHIPRDGDV